MYRENALPPPRPPRDFGAGHTPGWAWPATAVFLGAMAAIVLSLPGWDYRVVRVAQRLDLGWAVALAVVSAIGPALLLSGLSSRSPRLEPASRPLAVKVGVILGGGLVVPMLAPPWHWAVPGGPYVVVPAACLAWLTGAAMLSRTALLRFGLGVDELIRGRNATIPLTECAPPGFSGAETSRAFAARFARWIFKLAVFAGGCACVAGGLFLSQTGAGFLLALLFGFVAIVALFVAALLGLVGPLVWAGFCGSFLRTRTALRSRAGQLELLVDGVWRSVVSHEVVGPRIRFDADGDEVWCAPPGGLGPKSTNDGRDPSAKRRIDELGEAITSWHLLAAR